MYSSDLQDVDRESIAAFKIVLWVMIFLLVLLLQVSTAVELQTRNKQGRTILAGANFMKIIMRLLTLVLLAAAVPIFIKQIQTSVHNSLFSVFYVSLGLIIVFEVLAFVAAKFLRKK